MLDNPSALSGFLYEGMKRIIGRYGRLSSLASVVILLVGVVALSAASRQPCPQACSGTWHTYKAGHMTESERQEISAPDAAESAEDGGAETKASPPHYLPHEETLPIALPLTVQKHHFRSPPFLQ